MKRFISVLAAALSLTLLVSGCAKEPDASANNQPTKSANAGETGGNTAGATVPVQEPSSPVHGPEIDRTAPTALMWAGKCMPAGC